MVLSMKTDRLIAMLSVLLQREKVTAAEFADMFEVSRRTVLRDVDTLCRAGIPIVSVQGSGGGISVMENYKIDKTLLSQKDMKAILTGLQSLDSVSSTNCYRQLMGKLSVERLSSAKNDGGIIIDLSMWDKSAVSGKIETIEYAIDSNTMIQFTYYSPQGTTERIIEPYRLIFQWSNWYVWGYCTKRDDYRMFKLSRMTELKNIQKKYEVRNIPEYTCDKLRHTRGNEEITVKFDKSVKWRLIDEWGMDKFQYEEQSDGNIILKFTWEDKESLFNWILTFADSAEIISPVNCREEFTQKVRKIADKYDIHMSR